jgi:predicted transcriptional regulator of viral defense system
VRVELPIDVPFDYQLAMDRLAGFGAPRNKIRNLCRSGDLVRVKKGLYVAPTFPGRAPEVSPLVLAGLVYGPSYVSLESALAHHGLIPERVNEITSVTTKRAKRFDTPMGRFTYHPISEAAYSYGVTLASAAGGSFFLASPEKALCDRIARVRQLTAVRDIPALLEEDLRVDVDLARTLSVPEVREIARRYRKRSVSAFLRWLEKHA